MTLSKDLLLFFIERGEKDVAEHQQKVISNMEDSKLKLTIKTRQRALRYGSQKSFRFVFFVKSVFSRAMETERWQHGTVRSTVN